MTTRLEVHDDNVLWELQDASHGLEIVVDRRGVGAAVAEPLWGPRDGTKMTPYVNESLGATVTVTLWKWKRGAGLWLPLLESRYSREILFRGEGRHAGLEVMSTAEELKTHPALLLAMTTTPFGHPLVGAAVIAFTIMACICNCNATHAPENS